MNRSIHIAILAPAFMAAACGGKAVAPAAARTPADAVVVAGTYQTRATVVRDRNTCGSVTVQDHPTIVRHAPGSTRISLEHAGSTYTGTIDSSGRFTTPAASFAFPQADYSISLSGQFSARGFTATVDLTKRERGRTCTYAVEWVGTR